MNDARSLTPLSETDYEAIADAVMETSRGRWFMNEFARRNRRADTEQLLTAISRIERAVGVAAAPQEPSTTLLDTATLIADLRVDLERINARSDHPTNGLAARIEDAAGTIATAVEDVQELAWTLREAGVDEALCDRLDRRATEIFTANTVTEGGARQIGKIVDTVAMIDSSLRALAEGVEPVPTAGSEAMTLDALTDASTRPSRAAIELVEIDDAPRGAFEMRPVLAHSAGAARSGPLPSLEEDLFFNETHGTEEVALEGAPERTDQALRAIDAMPTAEKLAYFA